MRPEYAKALSMQCALNRQRITMCMYGMLMCLVRARAFPGGGLSTRDGVCGIRHL